MGEKKKPTDPNSGIITAYETAFTNGKLADTQPGKSFFAGDRRVALATRILGYPDIFTRDDRGRFPSLDDLRAHIRAQEAAAVERRAFRGEVRKKIKDKSGGRMSRQSIQEFLSERT